MTDRPILFSGPMVRALLDGRKSQTRRVLKTQPPADARYSGVHFASNEQDSWFFNSLQGSMKVRATYDDGDHLWVRETFCDPEDDRRPVYRADMTDDQLREEAGVLRSCRGLKGQDYRPWKPGMFMPRWASRLTLIVTNVRVQRLQDISAEDARDEGVDTRSRKVRQIDLFGATAEERAAQYLRACRWEYEDLWDSLNAKRAGCAWADNPWVVAVSFETRKANIDALASEAA